MIIKNSGMLAGVMTLVVHILAGLFGSTFIYAVYSIGIFPIVRFGYDYTFGLLPIATIYIFAAIVIFYMVRLMKSTLNSYKKRGLKTLPGHLAQRMLNGIGAIFFLFYFLWGFNYYQPNIEEELGFQEIKTDSSIIINEFIWATTILEKSRHVVSENSTDLIPELDWKELENEIRTSQKQVLKSWGHSTPGRVRVRKLLPEGLLLRFSTAGIYVPFVNEGHVDPGMNRIQWPFTMAHEMAHGYGYTDEGVCNFIGFLTCMYADDAFIRYSGIMGYWRYLYFEIKTMHPVTAKNMYTCLSDGIKNDLIAIRYDLNKYPDLMPVIRDKVYESYLKSHGVSKGLHSYDDIIIQVIKWKKSRYAFSIE
ncbi:MAG: DUF3810 domain-containing protein [Saprospiraceae bacterium]|nr:DUF3810 domain-containing protein [Saprospiraceae bacterium]